MKYVEILYCEKVWLFIILLFLVIMVNFIFLFDLVFKFVVDILEYIVVLIGVDCIFKIIVKFKFI